jgi:hypothetical protein
MMSRWLPVAGFGMLLTACLPGTAPSAVTLDQARADLANLVGDVTTATAYRYQLTDDLGRAMGPTEITYVPTAGLFAGVCFASSDVANTHFHVHVATSTDLLTWTWRTELADRGSQPSIAAVEGGGYVVAWEQEPDPIHNVIAWYDTWNDLLAGAPSRRLDVPITMPACGDGTPSIERATADRVEIGFHYHASCVRDLQAGGWTDGTSWHSAMRKPIDQALIGLGVAGHIGDRNRIKFEGHDLMLVEGNVVLEDWSTWRLFLYDNETEAAAPFPIRTHGRSRSQSNPTITAIEVGGRPALLVTVYLLTEGAAPGEDGELVYYRRL